MAGMRGGAAQGPVAATALSTGVQVWGICLQNGISVQHPLVTSLSL